MIGSPVTTSPLPISPAKKMKLNSMKTEMETKRSSSSFQLVPLSNASKGKSNGKSVTFVILK